MDSLTIWYDASGVPHEISSMKTDHIFACVGKIQRRLSGGKPWRLKYLGPLTDELLRRKNNPQIPT